MSFTYAKTYSEVLTRQQKLAVDAWQLIAANPTTWKQRVWRERAYGTTDSHCGAKLCWGGHVTMLDGGRFVTDNPDDSSLFEQLIATPGERDSINQRLSSPSGYSLDLHFISVRSRLRNIFRGHLTDEQVDQLTEGENSLEELQDYIIKYLGVDPETGELVKNKKVCFCGDPNCDYTF